MSTRPRIEFDARGRCNACVWSEEKKTLDWSVRQKELVDLLDTYRSGEGAFDCIVPVSGGKDGSYISYNLKYKHGMNPLTVTVRPALALDIGDQNLYNFIHSGYDHIHVTPNPKLMQILNKVGFIEKGFPYYGWLIAIKSAVISVAANYKIPLIFYAEDGEIEYGGSTENKDNALHDVEYMKRILFEGGYSLVMDKVLHDYEVNERDLAFWRFPDDETIKNLGLVFTHWSYFENWDPYRNYVVAKEHCGLIEKDEGSSGTFTNFAQNDQALYALHVYLMYLKFGFGRATQDAGIEIRRGAMDRDQAVNLVRLYDGQYPEEYMELYLDYYQMTQAEFDSVIDRWANRKLFEKVNGKWQPIFDVK